MSLTLRYAAAAAAAAENTLYVWKLQHASVRHCFRVRLYSIDYVLLFFWLDWCQIYCRIKCKHVVESYNSVLYIVSSVCLI